MIVKYVLERSVVQGFLITQMYSVVTPLSRCTLENFAVVISTPGAKILMKLKTVACFFS